MGVLLGAEIRGILEV